jgi:hypothetical protein
MNPGYVLAIDHVLGIHMTVEFTTRGPEVTDYAVVLIVRREGRAATIRGYDGGHGRNEMHRYSSSKGKQSGNAFHSGTLGEGMRAAIEAIECGHHQMIEGWERQ